jgi:IS1 family transposase
VNTKLPGILKFIVGNRSLETFRRLWQMIQGWECFLYITDGYKVYPCLIDNADHLVCKTAMTRVEGENCRLRHYLARLHRKTEVLFQIDGDVESLSTIADLLSSASPDSWFGLIHSLLGNTKL